MLAVFAFSLAGAAQTAPKIEPGIHELAFSAAPPPVSNSPAALATAIETEPNAPSPQTPASAPAPASPGPAVQSQHEKAEQEVQEEEKQRILGIVPNFNTSYDKNAPPLSPGEKFRLAFRSAIDPATIGIAALDAGWGMSQNSFPDYHQGVEGYAKYLGASYADSFDGTMIGNAIFPVLLKQDPRYFRMGEDHTFKRRILYAISTTVWCKNDNGKWGPNYSNVLGNLAAGGISNLYYPSANRGAGLTIERGMTVTAEGTLGALADEFWPDVARKLFKGRMSKGLPPLAPAGSTPPTAK